MSAYWKIPLQALVLLVGVLPVPVLHYSRRSLLIFDSRTDGAMRAGPQAREDPGVGAAVW